MTRKHFAFCAKSYSREDKLAEEKKMFDLKQKKKKEKHRGH